MAIVINAQSKCPLCNQIIVENEKIILFPPFVQNMKDSFYLFNDRGVHRTCLFKHPLGEQALLYLDEIIFKTRPENRRCDIGGNMIESIDNYLFIDLLTSDENEALYEFNFMTLDKRNISQWIDRFLFLNLASQFYEENKWESLTEFHYLKYLIASISEYA